MAAAMANRPRLRRAGDAITNFPLALQRGVDDRKALIARLEVDAGNTEQAAELVVGDLHRPGRGGGARRRLRKRGRARGVEGDVALDLLHHLVDVAVEHRHRTEALEVIQRAGAVLGAPAPGRIDRPQRNMGEHDDGHRFRPYSAVDGLWANTTMGIDFDLPLRSSSSHSSCAVPRLPRPPALRSTTLTRPMKWTPLASNEYQPAPLVPRP